MAQKRIDQKVFVKAITAVEGALKKGYRPPGASGGGPAAINMAAQALGISRTTLSTRLATARVRHKMVPDWSLWKKPASASTTIAPAETEDPKDVITRLIRKAPRTLEELAGYASLTPGETLDLLGTMTKAGSNIRQLGNQWSIEKDPEQAWTLGELPVYESRPDNTYVFGATSDNHLGSKYERLDVLEDLYDRFAKRGVDRVFNAGNWVDGYGRAGFNRNDLRLHGMDEQLDYLAEVYPKRDGIKTYAVAGNDHEGWWGQREGIDIGRHAENVMRNHGRDDWINLGFMEAHVILRNVNTGKEAILAVVHPGGGTAYALSYSVQKIIEALEGGEKPAVGLYGHYHKLGFFLIRNVFCLMTGCTQDQTTFMRSKVKQEAHVGGATAELEQDPETGAIISMKPDITRYFNKGYYNNRWCYGGPVNLPVRKSGP